MKSKYIRTVARVGDIYGRLTILEVSPIRTRVGGVTVTCQCSCGTIKDISMKALRGKQTTSCGCLRKEITSNRNSLPSGFAGRNELFKKYEKCAKDRGLLFLLTKEKFWELTVQDCHYCGVAPSNVWQKGRYNGDYIWNGVDRKDSSIGYQLGNCVPCCSTCNKAKGSLSYVSFITWILRLTNKVRAGPNMYDTEEIKI